VSPAAFDYLLPEMAEMHFGDFQQANKRPIKLSTDISNFAKITPNK
jgi:hypothetical protein